MPPQIIRVSIMTCLIRNVVFADFYLSTIHPGAKRPLKGLNGSPACFLCDCSGSVERFESLIQD